MRRITKNSARARKPRILKNLILKRAKKQHRKSSAEKKPKSASSRQKRDFISCPKCGSSNLLRTSALQNLWSAWECRRCGYHGAFIAGHSRMTGKAHEDYVTGLLKH